MMKEKISGIRQRCENALRRACGRISPGRRVALVVGLCLVFAIVNVWLLTDAATDMVRGSDRNAIRVDHIELPDWEVPAESTDSLMMTPYD